MPRSTSAALFGELIDFVVDFWGPRCRCRWRRLSAPSALWKAQSQRLNPELNLLALVTENGRGLLHKVGGLRVTPGGDFLRVAAVNRGLARPLARIAGRLPGRPDDVGTMD